MRVTTKQLNNHMQRVIHDRYADLTDIQEKLATGKKLMRPSDDPVNVANDLQLRSKLSVQKQHKENIEDTKAFMGVTDTTLSSMNDLMQRMRELAIQGSNETNSATERNFIQQEVTQLTRQVISMLNTTYKNEYIFGGTQTRITPFPPKNSIAQDTQDYSQLKMAYYDGSGGTGSWYQIRDAQNDEAIRRILPDSFSISVGGTSYQEGTDYEIDYVNGRIRPLNAALAADLSDGGTFTGPNYQASGFQMEFDYVSRGEDIYGNVADQSGIKYREIEPGVQVPVNITAQEVTEDRDSNLNLLDSMIRLGENLREDNTSGIQDGISEIDSVYNNILSQESKNGARFNRIEKTLQRNENKTVETTRLQSELEDADMAKVISDFSLMQNVYNAALKSAARVIQPTLVNFL